MDTIDKPAPAIWNIIRVSGILLILWSLYSLWIAYDQTKVIGWIDFNMPCAVSYDLHSKDTSMPSDVRIDYCIESRQYKMEGLGYYATGRTRLNEVMAGELKLRRQEQTLFVNDQPLQIGESYDVVRQNPSNNPWLRFTTHFVIVNSGLYSGSSALYVTGNVKEDWQVSPLGAIILVSGIGLVMLGNWGTKRTKIARGQYVMEPSVPRNIKAREIAVGFFGWIIFSTLSFPLLYLLFRFFALTIFGHFNEYDNLYLIWLPAIITILVLYRKKRFLICTGVVLAIAVNSAIWISILRADNFFFYALPLSGIPLPLILLALLVITLL
jgi:hypothetical protein